jgi:prolyl-tRNA synthetase
MSERLIGAIVGIHGDNKGIILPPAVAPYQVVIVPILVKKMKAKVMEACNKLTSELVAGGLRVYLDSRDIRPGSKYYDWELRGVPLRLELGPRDLEKDEVTVVRRDIRDSKRSQVPRDSILKLVRELLSEIESSLWENADRMLKDSIITVDAIDEARDKSGVIRVGWCGDPECDDQMCKFIEMNMLGTPIDDEGFSGNCGQCGKPTTKVAYYARTY